MKGSVEKRVAKDGTVTWTCRVDVPGPDGKRRQKRVSAPTRRELEAVVAKVLHQINTGSYLEPSKATLGDYLAQWHEGLGATVRGSTIVAYRTSITCHLTPALGSVPLAKVTPARVQAYYAARLAAGAAPSTVRGEHAVLRRALQQAVEWKLIAVNPCASVKAPRPAPPEMRTWTAEQVRAFLVGTADDDLAALWRLALLTGARKGELLALRWADIDLERGAMAVRRTVTRNAERKWTIGEPKTTAGRRSIALPASCVAALRRHQTRQKERRLRCGEAWQDTGLILDRGDGGMHHPFAFERSFHRLTEHLALPRIRFHDLRHTAATLMLAEGVHPKVVQERLGHSAIAMTLNLYSHVSMDMQRDAAERLDRLAGGL